VGNFIQPGETKHSKAYIVKSSDGKHLTLGLDETPGEINAWLPRLLETDLPRIIADFPSGTV